MQDDFNPVSRRDLIIASGAGAAGTRAERRRGRGNRADPRPEPGRYRQGRRRKGHVSELEGRDGASRRGRRPRRCRPRSGSASPSWALGRLSLEEILPAFGEAKRAKPVALGVGHAGQGQSGGGAVRHRSGGRVRLRVPSTGSPTTRPSRPCTSCCRTRCTTTSCCAPPRPASTCCARSRWPRGRTRRAR